MCQSVAALSLDSPLALRPLMVVIGSQSASRCLVRPEMPDSLRACVRHVRIQHPLIACSDALCCAINREAHATRHRPQLRVLRLPSPGPVANFEPWSSGIPRSGIPRVLTVSDFFSEPLTLHQTRKSVAMLISKQIEQRSMGFADVAAVHLAPPARLTVDVGLGGGGPRTHQVRGTANRAR